MIKSDKVTVVPPLMLIDNEIFDAKGRLLAKVWREDVGKILLNRLNSQPGLLSVCEKIMEGYIEPLRGSKSSVAGYKITIDKETFDLFIARISKVKGVLTDEQALKRIRKVIADAKPKETK